MVGALDYAQPFENKITAARPPLFDAAEIPGIVGTDLSRPFDPREIIARLVDGSAFHEFKPDWGETLVRSEEHTSELQSLMRISYAVFCLKKKKNNTQTTTSTLHPNIQQYI